MSNLWNAPRREGKSETDLFRGQALDRQAINKILAKRTETKNKTETKNTPSGDDIEAYTKKQILRWSPAVIIVMAALVDFALAGVLVAFYVLASAVKAFFPKDSDDETSFPLLAAFCTAGLGYCIAKLQSIGTAQTLLRYTLVMCILMFLGVWGFNLENSNAVGIIPIFLGFVIGFSTAAVLQG